MPDPAAPVPEADPKTGDTRRHIEEALRGLRFGEVTAIVHDGVVVPAVAKDRAVLPGQPGEHSLGLAERIGKQHTAFSALPIGAPPVPNVRQHPSLRGLAVGGEIAGEQQEVGDAVEVGQGGAELLAARL